MDVRFWGLKESKKSSFDSYSVRTSVLIISYITFLDYRVHIFYDNLSRNSCIQPSKHVLINKNGLRQQNNYFDVVISNKPNFTICVVMNLWLNRNFDISFTINSVSTKVLSFNKSTKELSLITNPGTEKITIPTSLFNGEKVVLWFAENSGANVMKASLSNYASTLTKNSHTFRGTRNKIKLDTEDGMFYEFMYSSKFYDFDSDQYHRYCFKKS